ncbi:hypothetical protein L3Q82_001587 [Scortum barcoo]|uniref:Uncharacterized protein n=1 Tax=Scortum barcoo TaxID=214431 RepID=A0ACB8W8D4_9TELE|nr:hypothetical protein L3Q82_001587 [Scortum barcoo]
MTQLSSASSGMVMSLCTDGKWNSLQSEQPGAEHAQNCGDDSGLQKEPPNTAPPFHPEQHSVSAVETFRFLGSTISQDLKWESNIDAIRKKAQQRMYFLRQLRKFNVPQELLIQFYTTIIQSVLCTSITVCFGSATKQNDRNRLQRTVRAAEKIIGASLPSIQDLYMCPESGNGQPSVIDHEFCACPLRILFAQQSHRLLAARPSLSAHLDRHPGLT